MANEPEDPPEVSPEEFDRRVREGMEVLSAVARSVSRRLGGKVPLDDLRGHGSQALLYVARTFYPRRAKFHSYAALKLKWAIFDGLRRESRGRIAARANALLASERFGAEADREGEGPADASPGTEEGYAARLGGLLAGHAAALAIGLVSRPERLASVADAGENAEERLASEQFKALVRERVRELPVRERALVERHYFGGEQFDAIARDLGISKSWASRIHAQAIAQLRDALVAPSPASSTASSTASPERSLSGSPSARPR